MDRVEGEFVGNPGLHRQSTGNQELAGRAMIGQVNGRFGVIIAGRVVQFVKGRGRVHRETMGMERTKRRQHDGEKINAARDFSKTRMG